MGRHGGILRLGPGSQPAATWIETAFETGKLDEPVFTLNLIDNHEETEKKKSSLTLGQCLCPGGSKRSIDLDMTDGQYGFKGNSEIHFDGTFDYRIDSGSWFMTLSDEEVNQYIKAVKFKLKLEGTTDA